MAPYRDRRHKCLTPEDRFRCQFASYGVVIASCKYYGEGYAFRMAKIFHVVPMGLQRQIDWLEGSGFVVSRLVGRTRVFPFKGTDPTVKYLRIFLASELTRSPGLFEQYA